MQKQKKPEFYSDLSPLKKAWRALWEKPRGNQKDAIELNNELIKKIIDDESNCYPDLRQKAIEEPIELPYNYEQTPDYLDTIKWIEKGYCPCGDSNPETQAACSTNGCPMYKCELIKDKK